MSDERTPEQEQARYRDLTPAKAVEHLEGVESVGHVRKLIRLGLLRARDVGTGQVPHYKISMDEIRRFNRWTLERVRERRDDAETHDSAA